MRLEDMKTPASFEYNVEVTRAVVKMAHACGVSVEGEIGCLGSLENRQDVDHSQLLTDPDEAVEFVRQTQVDALAVAIGTSHGAYKFSKPPIGEVLVISRLKALQQRLPDTHFVMHGSSSVPQDWLKIINEYGGSIPETYGVPVKEIVEGIKYGVRKVNIDTDLRMASTGAMRRFLAQPENASELDARKTYQGRPRHHAGAMSSALRSLRLRRARPQNQGDSIERNGEVVLIGKMKMAGSTKRNPA
jgi:fructose-bisphosphate aldolase class II